MNPRSRGLSSIALAGGLGSIACVVLYLLTELGWSVAAPAMILGLVGVGFGIAALKKRQHRGMAVTGLVSGAIGFVFIAGLFIFALAFLGVLTGEAS